MSPYSPLDNWFEFGVNKTGFTMSSSAQTNDAVIKSHKNMMLQSGSGAASLYIDTSNNIGIGNSAPTDKLDITGYTKSSSGYKTGSYGQVIDSSGNFTGLNGTLTNNLTVATNTLFVDSSNNNVGIGTITPNSEFKLDILGDTRIKGNLKIDGITTVVDTVVENQNTTQLNITNVGTGPAVTIKQTGAQDILQVDDDANTCFIIKDNGKILIGGIATSTYHLDVSGNTHFVNNVDVSQNVNVTGNAKIIGSLTCGSMQIDGNFGVKGDFDLSQNFRILGDKFTVDPSGNVTAAGKVNIAANIGGAADLDLSGNFKILTNKFTVDPSGNVTAAGNVGVAGNIGGAADLDLSGNFKILTNKFTVDPSGNVGAAGNVNVAGNIGGAADLDLSGNFKILTNKFTVDPSGNVGAAGNVGVAGNIGGAADLDLSGNFKILTNKFTVDPSGNVGAAGNVGVAGNIGGAADLDLSGNFKILTNKFTVDPSGNVRAAGNVGVAGNLDISNNFRILDTKFTVDPSGNVGAAGNIDLSGNLATNHAIVFDISNNGAFANKVNNNETDYAIKQSAAGQTTINGKAGAGTIQFTHGDGTIKQEFDLNGNIIIQGNLFSYSDARIKTNIETIENALDKVTSIRGVTYNMIKDIEIDPENAQKHIGVIAQEIESVIPEAVKEENGIKTVAYGNIVGLLIEAIKELKDQIKK
jgi:hypothetical protein